MTYSNWVRRTLSGLIGASTIFLAGMMPAASQTFPSKPVKAVLPYSAGSGPDTVVRLIGEKLAQEWGQPLLIENKPGANSWFAAGEVKKAAPDGYTVLVADAGTISLQPSLYKQMPFDAAKDFEPAAPLYSTNFLIIVGMNSPYKTVGDLIAAAKVSEGKVTYGSWGVGSPAHLGAALFESGTGTQMTHVPFKELPQLYTAVANGDVDWAIGSAATAGALYRAKKLRYLAYAGPKRMTYYPDVPTVSESGGPAKFEVNTWSSMFAPKGTPKAVIDRIHAGVQKALAEPDVKARLAADGIEPWHATPAEVSRVAEADKLRYAEIVRRAKISIE